MMQTYLSDILHVVAQNLLAPDIILLLAFIAYALYCIGSIVAEAVTERRHFKVIMPKFLDELMDADEADIPTVIEESGLLRRQKNALMTVYEYRKLPGDALVALIKREVNEEETRYDRIVGRNNVAARVAPMLGLMGTLIPLGPGIEALGRADTAALSSSLLVAFDTTVAGLVVAAVCLIIGKIRNNWYEDYLSALDAAMATMLEKIESMQPKQESSDSYALQSAIERILDFKPAPQSVQPLEPVIPVVEAPLPEPQPVQPLEPIAPVVESPIEQPAEEPIVQPVEEPIAEPIIQLVDEPIEEPAEQPVEESAEQPIVQPIEEATEQLVEEPIVQPIEEFVEQPVEEPLESSLQHLYELPLEQLLEQPIISPIEEPVLLQFEEPVEEPFEEQFEEPFESFVPPVQEFVQEEQPVRRVKKKKAPKSAVNVIMEPLKDPLSNEVMDR